MCNGPQKTWWFSWFWCHRFGLKNQQLEAGSSQMEGFVLFQEHACWIMHLSLLVPKTSSDFWLGEWIWMVCHILFTWKHIGVNQPPQEVQSVFPTFQANFFELYEIGDLLGSGSFGQVRKCWPVHEPATRYAVKVRADYGRCKRQSKCRCYQAIDTKSEVGCGLENLWENHLLFGPWNVEKNVSFNCFFN